jgi:hypothetical protein
MCSEGVQYIVGTARSKLDELEAELLDLPWQQVHENVRVKLLVEDGDLYVLAQSTGRREKEKSIRRHKLRRLFEGLRRLQKNCTGRDRLLQKLGALKHEAGRAAGFLQITLPPSGSKVTAKNFTFSIRFNP